MQIKVFSKKRAIFAIILSLFAIFLINLSLIFFDFKNFKNEEIFKTKGEITQNYIKTKNSKSYQVLKFKTKNFDLYTTNFKRNLNSNVGEIYEFNIITKNVKFKDFLSGSFYAPSFKFQKIDKINQNSIKNYLINAINSQHKTALMQEFYNALYLATPISKELRSYVVNWGSAHIVAISGFHIGIIFAFVFTFIVPILRFFQDRFFPYRNIYKDVNWAIFVLLVFYLFLLDFTPSFLRSLIMSFIIYVFLLRNYEIINFATLLFTFLICVAFSPKIVFNIGFYFSCMGVLYIYLYLVHFSHIKFKKFNLFVHWILLNFWTFFGMNFIVYYFFSTFSIQQMAVIPLGAIFVIFYPLSVFLHLIGEGGLFDFYMINFLKFNLPTANIYPSFFIFILANFFAIAGIFSKKLAVCGIIFGSFAIFFVE